MATTNNHTQNPPLTIGMALFGNAVQMLDIIGIELFYVISPEYLSVVASAVPAAAKLLPNAPAMRVLWISDDGPAKPFGLTSNTAVTVTHDFASAPQCDIVLVPGPDPSGPHVSDAGAAFLRRQISGGLYALLTVCSGIIPTLQAGVLDGKTVSGPRWIVPALRQQFPTTTFNELRWQTDYAGADAAAEGEAQAGNPFLAQFDRAKNGCELWTSGGTLNGVDMVTQFIREKFPPEFFEFSMHVADAPQRPREYGAVEYGAGAATAVV